jgi:hypothetical protein
MISGTPQAQSGGKTRTACYIKMTAFTIVMMVKIHKWSKSDKMLAPLNLYDR